MLDSFTFDSDCTFLLSMANIGLPRNGTPSPNAKSLPVAIGEPSNRSSTATFGNEAGWSDRTRSVNSSGNSDYNHVPDRCTSRSWRWVSDTGTAGDAVAVKRSNSATYEGVSWWLACSAIAGDQRALFDELLSNAHRCGLREALRRD